MTETSTLVGAQVELRPIAAFDQIMPIAVNSMHGDSGWLPAVREADLADGKCPTLLQLLRSHLPAAEQDHTAAGSPTAVRFRDSELG